VFYFLLYFYIFISLLKSQKLFKLLFCKKSLGGDMHSLERRLVIIVLQCLMM